MVVRAKWYAAWPPDEEERLLPLIGESDEMVVETVRSVRKRTKAPKHFTHAPLVRELEKAGDRPSASTRPLADATERCSVVDWLARAFPELLDYGLTARL